jgi:hypothetical protein
MLKAIISIGHSELLETTRNLDSIPLLKSKTKMQTSLRKELPPLGIKEISPFFSDFYSIFQ